MNTEQTPPMKPSALPETLARQAVKEIMALNYPPGNAEDNLTAIILRALAAATEEKDKAFENYASKLREALKGMVNFYAQGLTDEDLRIGMEKAFAPEIRAEYELFLEARECLAQSSCLATEEKPDFHRQMGITLLDAKYLDPACHKGCQSLVHQSKLTELERENRELREDKARLDFVIEQNPVTLTSDLDGFPCIVFPTGKLKTGPTIRGIIDAARNELKQSAEKQPK